MKLLIYILFFGFYTALMCESTFSGDRLKQACIDYIYFVQGNSVEISIRQNVKDQYFENDDVVAKCIGNKNSLRGNCFVAIEFYHNERMLRRIEIPSKIKIYKYVPVARNNIGKDEIIDFSKISFEKKDITYLMDEILSKEEIIGKRINQRVTAGTVLTGGLIENDLSIRRGDKVRIIAQSGAVRISSTAEVLQDASVGQTVRVKREGTRDILEGYLAKDGSIYIIKN